MSKTGKSTTAPRKPAARTTARQAGKSTPSRSRPARAGARTGAGKTRQRDRAPVVIEIPDPAGPQALQSLYASLAAALESGDGIVLDAGGIDDCPTPQLQLLCAFVTAARKARRDVRWSTVTPGLLASARLLDLHDRLELPPAPAS